MNRDTRNAAFSVQSPEFSRPVIVPVNACIHPRQDAPHTGRLAKNLDIQEVLIASGSALVF